MPIASTSSKSNSNKSPTHSYDISLQSTQFQSIKEIASSEINVQRLLHGLSTAIGKEKINLSGGSYICTSINHNHYLLL